MVAILHNVRSLFNVGSIFRSSDAVGLEKLYLCGVTPEPLDVFREKRPQLTKVSLGAEDTVPWEKCTSTIKTIVKLKSEGYKIVAVEQANNSVPYFDIKVDKNKLALVMGHEVKGLPKNILDLADIIAEIPMYGKKESLNVGVAFGVVAFRLAESLMGDGFRPSPE
jgi:tRNA G18 (ribose-2'-O)-methylase SpoU